MIENEWKKIILETVSEEIDNYILRNRGAKISDGHVVAILYKLVEKLDSEAVEISQDMPYEDTPYKPYRLV